MTEVPNLRYPLWDAYVDMWRDRKTIDICLAIKAILNIEKKIFLKTTFVYVINMTKALSFTLFCLRGVSF